MLLVKKSLFCGISANFLQCCFMSVMAVSDFSGLFSRNDFLIGGFIFQLVGVFLGWVRVSFLCGVWHTEGISFRGGSGGRGKHGGGLSRKIMGWGVFPTRRNPEHKVRNIVCCRLVHIY